jgi:hypothetical protein
VYRYQVPGGTLSLRQGLCLAKFMNGAYQLVHHVGDKGARNGHSSGVQ